MEQTDRQRKIASVLQKDLAVVLQKEAQQTIKGLLISISKVLVTSDLAMAKVYVSVFPSNKRASLLASMQANTATIRYEIARRTRNQLRRMPELFFFADDSLDYIEKIDNALQEQEEENPIKNPDLLPKRQKR